CAARGGTSSVCASCCDCGASECIPPSTSTSTTTSTSSTSTTTLPHECQAPVDFPFGVPMCDGSCPAGEHCALSSIFGRGCSPDGTLTCGENLSCGGVCPEGEHCASAHFRFGFSTAEIDACSCVGPGSLCAGACGGPADCPEGLRCNVYITPGPGS